MLMHNPLHPGSILRNCMGTELTVGALAEHLGVTRAHVSMILNGRLGISPAFALKLGDAFPHQDAQFWLNLQSQYDLAQARKKKRTSIRPVTVAAA